MRVGTEVAPSQNLQTSGDEAQAAHGGAGLFCWVEGGGFFGKFRNTPHCPANVCF